MSKIDQGLRSWTLCYLSDNPRFGTTDAASLSITRLRRLGDSGRTQGNAQAVAVEAVRRVEPVPVRRTTNRGNAAPTAATEHADRALFWTSRIADRTLGVLTIPGAAPFPDVPVHVV